MFNLLVELGARLDIKNRQGLTPLTLAAKLTRKEVLIKPMIRRKNKMSRFSGTAASGQTSAVALINLFPYRKGINFFQFEVKI